ncbi:hypothetical protein LHFGNBLO_002920 [Mesorhizobium sp. AR10]|uniref:hypothetical protein n=1 Tax=Mesorhizobium sp. AR10 TaxID=2865839 RepID=UPI00215FED39|nr:hypothetical protein [Mesorhizobium sp. AR10]UVK41333.1 hypothetical protein LHFGNBLO_002920 [Mesorhizobium sp. AR10]
MLFVQRKKAAHLLRRFAAQDFDFNAALRLLPYRWRGSCARQIVEVILFYALLIGGLGLAITAYLVLLMLPVGLIARKFGLLAGVAFATVLIAVLFMFYRPPLGGVTVSFAPPGMRANLYIVQMVEHPPVAMLVAGAAVSAAGLVIVMIASLLRRA